MLLIEKQGKNLTTIKGVSTIIAARFVAHANGIDRFPKVSKFIRYAGIAPVERSSGKKKRHLRDIRKMGIPFTDLCGRVRTSSADDRVIWRRSHSDRLLGEPVEEQAAGL